MTEYNDVVTLFLPGDYEIVGLGALAFTLLCYYIVLQIAKVIQRLIVSSLDKKKWAHEEFMLNESIITVTKEAAKEQLEEELRRFSTEVQVLNGEIAKTNKELGIFQQRNSALVAILALSDEDMQKFERVLKIINKREASQ